VCLKKSPNLENPLKSSLTSMLKNWRKDTNNHEDFDRVKEIKRKGLMEF